MKKVSIAVIIISLVLSITALGISIYNLSRIKQDAAKTSEVQITDEAETDVQYVLYLGTNDKDTYEPFGTPEEAKAKVDEVLTKHVEGFTIQDANGGWTNENGTVDHEYTIVIYLSDTDIDTVHATADDLIKEFNQSSILIQENKTKTEFYSH